VALYHWNHPESITGTHFPFISKSSIVRVRPLGSGVLKGENNHNSNIQEPTLIVITVTAYTTIDADEKSETEAVHLRSFWLH
jgi:hypothetical protein